MRFNGIACFVFAQLLKVRQKFEWGGEYASNCKLYDCKRRQISYLCFIFYFHFTCFNTLFRSLNWITTNELKCPLNESSQEVRDLFNESIHDILEVDGKMTPQEKLECVVRYFYFICENLILRLLPLNSKL